MLTVELTRICKRPNLGVFGVLVIDWEPFCVTLEPPDWLNKQNLSCIPTGQYLCKRVMSPKYRNTFMVMDVPDRGNILFHAGNIKKHTKGCILVAEHFGKLYGDLAVLNSGNTFRAFKKRLKHYDAFRLTIRECY